MRSLVVEDESYQCMLMEKLLEPFGEVSSVCDGDNAVQEFRRALHENRPYDLICLDIMMPGMDGHQTLREIRKIERGKKILLSKRVKVIMTTLLTDSMNIREAYESECEGYLVKPIDRDRLLAQLRVLGMIPEGG